MKTPRSSWVTNILLSILFFSNADAQQHGSNQNYGNANSIICETDECRISAISIMMAMNTSADPCSDFYSNVCGKWIKQLANFPKRINTASRIDILTRRKMESILNSPVTTYHIQPQRELRNFYKACLNKEAHGNNEVHELLNIMEIMNIFPMIQNHWNEDQFHLEEALAIMTRIGAKSFLSIDVVDNPYQYLPPRIMEISADKSRSMLFGGTTLDFERYLTSWLQFLSLNLNMTQVVNIEQRRIDEVVSFNAKLFNISASQQNIMTDLHNLSSTHGNTKLNWDLLIRLLIHGRNVNSTDNPFIIYNEEFISNLMNLLSNSPKSTLADFLGIAMLRTFGPEISFQMKRIVLTYETIPSSVRNCLEHADLLMNYAMVKEYVDHVNNNLRSTVNKAQAIFFHMEHTFEDYINNNSLGVIKDSRVITEYITENIIDFLRDLRFGSEMLEDVNLIRYYAGLNVSSNHHLINLINLNSFVYSKRIAELDGTNINEYNFFSTTIKQLGTPLNKAYTIPASLLGIPFIYPTSTRGAVNFGSFGSLVGYEIARRINNVVFTESLFNGTHIYHQVMCFIDHYSNLNISLTRKNLPDLIAEHVGVKIALKALEEYGDGEKLPGFEDYNEKQMFFVAYVREMCEKVDENDSSDGFSIPWAQRVQAVLKNMPEFHAAFGCVASNQRPTCSLY